jgi:hypothetical protein
MARRRAKVGATQKVMGYCILAVLVLITVWLLVQQSRFNPAVTAAGRAPLLVARAPAPGAAASALAALLPDAAGFTPVSPPESYGPETLSDKIDGRAELYLSAGFKEMSCRSFNLAAFPGARVEVFLYDMGAAPNAFAVFSSQRRPGGAALAVTPQAYATPNALFFTRGRFYVEIVADRAAEGLQSLLETYASALLAKLPAEGETQDAATLFPKEGLAAESVRLNAADAFGLEGFNNVYTGEYTLTAGKATAFLARRESPERARAEAERYSKFLTDNGYQKVEAKGAPAEFTVLSLDNSFEIVFVQGQTLAGVHDAPSREAALELAGRVVKALKGKP